VKRTLRHKGRRNSRVPAEGPRSARIVFFGESPWKTEAALGRPFVGAAGNLQRRWWKKVGLRREEIWIDNVYPFLPPEPAPPGKGKVPARIYKALGQKMTQTDAERRAGITKLRGSIYEYTDLNGRKIKVIPTIHPSGVQQHPAWEARTIKDWQRIKEEAQTHELRLPKRQLVIDPTYKDVVDFIQHCQAHPETIIAIDIETWGRTLSCVGFADSPTHAIVLQTSPKRCLERWLPWIKAICALPNVKVLQNGLY